jgi:Protein of unknown function (DUF4038)/Domain of unknown function (DUF5060)/Putative collagen-binding domain of a collagenase
MPGSETTLWGRWEAAFTATGAAAPETELTVELAAPSGRALRVAGFWDGSETWRARVMPDEEGEWRYRTRSAPRVAGLDGAAGSFVCGPSVAGNRFRHHGTVSVSADGHFLQHADGTPFFWLGDTVWNGALLSADADWERFLRDRAEKRFTAIQFVATPWRTAYADAEGDIAYDGKEHIAIHPRFFQRMDARIDAINAAGLLAVPVMLWAIASGGGVEHNPGRALPDDQVLRLARYMVARYGAHHVAWILAGDDNYSGENAERWKRIGRAVFGDGGHAPVLLHPQGMQWPFESFREEAWLDVFGYQSGHGDDDRALAWIHSGPPSQAWQHQPARPILNLEPPYEDHLAYQSRQPHSAYSVRRAVYWSLLNAPTAGVTYGAHGVWSWETAPGVPLNHERTGLARPWHEAMALPGSTHMQHAAALLTSLPWWQLHPDERLLDAQPGGEDPARHVSAAGTADGAVAVLYLPVGGEVRLSVGAMRGEWSDPRTGDRQPARDEGKGRFRAPDDQDWVLLLRRP